MCLNADLEIRSREPLDALLAALAGKALGTTSTTVCLARDEVAALARLGVVVEVVVYRPDQMKPPLSVEAIMPIRAFVIPASSDQSHCSSRAMRRSRSLRPAVDPPRIRSVASRRRKR